MRVLFDQPTPVPIRTFLIGHTVRTRRSNTSRLLKKAA